MEKSLIRKEILSQKRKEKPNYGYIQRLQQLLDKAEITLEDFSSMGRFIQRGEFTESYPRIVLHAECTDILFYVGGYFIQALKGGKFIAGNDDTTEFGSVPEAEKYLWSKVKK